MSKKAIIIIIIIAVFFMGLFGAGFFILWSKLSAAIPAAETTEVEEGEEAEVEEEIKPLYPMETFIVNLADRGGKRYLRVTMQLEMDSEEVKDEIDRRLPHLRNSILMILPSKSYQDVDTAQGKIALRDEIIVNLNTVLNQEAAVTNLFFTEFVVQ